METVPLLRSLFIGNLFPWSLENISGSRLKINVSFFVSFLLFSYPEKSPYLDLI